MSLTKNKFWISTIFHRIARLGFFFCSLSRFFSPFGCCSVIDINRQTHTVSLSNIRTFSRTERWKATSEQGFYNLPRKFIFLSSPFFLAFPRNPKSVLTANEIIFRFYTLFFLFFPPPNSGFLRTFNSCLRRVCKKPNFFGSCNTWLFGGCCSAAHCNSFLSSIERRKGRSSACDAWNFPFVIKNMT